jgi:restriction endonuclease BglII
MSIELIPKDLRARFRFDERGHATAILKSDFIREFNEILGALRAFTLKRSDILTPGGGRSPIPIAIDGFLGKIGWSPKSFDIKITIDGHPVPIPRTKSTISRIAWGLRWNGTTRRSSMTGT